MHDVDLAEFTHMNTNSLEFDPERSLPAIAYRDPTWLAAEVEYIWHGDWVFATTENTLSKPGDQVPLLIGNQPVLLLRNQREQLVALSNLCAHRGTLLVEKPTNDKRIQCPYHSWTYDDSGCLVGAPFAPPETIDWQAHSLPVFRVESWHGLIFVSLNPDVEGLDKRFDAIEHYVSARGTGKFHGSQQQSTEIWRCNWKVAMLNAMESYHLFKVHPKTLETYTPTKSAYYVTGSARATATGGSYKDQSDYLLISLPPGFVGIVTQDGFFWEAVRPLTSDTCEVRIGGTSSFGDNANSHGRIAEWLTRLGAATLGLGDFLAEDKAICERIQSGMSGDFVSGKLVPIERVVIDFGHYLNWRLNQIDPPSVYTERNS